MSKQDNKKFLYYDLHVVIAMVTVLTRRELASSWKVGSPSLKHALFSF